MKKIYLLEVNFRSFVLYVEDFSTLCNWDLFKFIRNIFLNFMELGRIINMELIQPKTE